MGSVAKKLVSDTQFARLIRHKDAPCDAAPGHVYNPVFQINAVPTFSNRAALETPSV